MGKGKDVSEKVLEDYNEVFADIVNNLLFSGREVVKAEELENAVTVSQLKMADGLHEQERDTAKYWKRGAITIAAIGFENQSFSDQTMPLRSFSYDGTSYKSQVNRYNSEQKQKRSLSPFYPAVTIVLHFGQKRWTGPRTLRECFQDVPPELEAFIPNYAIHVVDVAFLTPEEVGRLKSDFRFVADYLVQTRTSGDYVPSDGRIVHVDETLKLLGAITGDSSFQETMNMFEENGKENMTMCDVVQKFRNEGREQGRVEGRAEEREQGIRVLVETVRDFTQDKDAAIQRLIRAFSLSPASAAEKVAQYWT